MIRAQTFIELLGRKGIHFFAGVPDSRLASLCTVLQETLPKERHIIAANEGNALGLAIGHYLATAEPALVYMQNSGLGNAVNPLTSLADREVYSIPMLLVIGWRGSPGEKDEPQHIKQGRISDSLLELLEIPYAVLTAETCLKTTLDSLCSKMLTNSSPVALLVKDGAFAPEKRENGPANPACALTREAAIAALLEAARPEDCILATTGKTGRELFELRVLRQDGQQDFLCVGGMGHCSSIALGAALARPGKRFICLDGDGAMLMHLGALGIIGTVRPQNFVHILLNNQCHESVGGQPTCVAGLDLGAIAKACGYPSCTRAKDQDDIKKIFTAMQNEAGPHFLEILVGGKARSELGRPTESPARNKAQFMQHLGSL